MSVVFIIMLAISWPLSTLIHELGHGLPALWFTKGKVKLIVGVKKPNDTNSISIYAGRLELHMKLNPFKWSYGYCTHEHTGKIPSLIILVGGAGTMFLCASAMVAWYYTQENVHPWIVAFIYSFSFASVLGLRNLIPNEEPFYYNGIKMYNDGYQIKELLNDRLSSHSNMVSKIEYHIRYQEYPEAILLCRQAIDVMPENRALHHKLISILAITKDREALLVALEYMQAKVGLDYFAFMHKGDYYLAKNDFKNALLNFVYATTENPKDAIAYNNLGYARGMLGQYKESIQDLNKAILLDYTQSFAYNNRGYAFLMLGEMNRAYDDLAHSWELDVENAYCFRNFGIYFLKKKQKEIALLFFKKTRELDPNVPMLEKYEKEAAETVV